MSSVRSAAALRRLYERYRTAPTLKTSARRPGEWLVIEPASEDASSFEVAFGIAPDASGAEAAVQALVALNGALGVRHARDVRLVAQRVAARSRKLELRFVLVTTGKTTKGSKPTPRTELPAVPTQLGLDQKVDVHEKVDVQKPTTTTGGTTAGTEVEVGVDDVPMLLPDGTPIPDLSDMLMEHELAELWQTGKLSDLDAMDALFGGFDHLLKQVLDDEEEVDVGSMADRFRARAVLASGTPPIEPTASDVGDTWENVSRDVVAWVKDHVRALRDAGATGHMLVLAPSPGTGKSRGMMEAADAEQGARRRVGYAVLSRAQIPEAKERLLATNPNVRLIVIEGRNEKNCISMDQVTVATSAGFSPGSTVCPNCPMYPKFGYSRRNVCGYYGSRIDAHRDRFNASMHMHAPAIILTTHASAIQGSHIIKRRFQSFWDFDTLFLDEDPTSSMVTEHEIAEEALTYSKLDHKGNPDGPTAGTRLLREVMRRAMREREEAAERDFELPDGSDDRIHSRDYGSSYAGADLHALLVAVAGDKHRLRAIGSGTIDGMSGPPPKGEIMSLSADEVANKYPNRFLAPLFATLDEEAIAIAEARAAGTELEPAYRVHLDVVPDGEGGHRPLLKVHLLRGYANGRTNIVIGDAYGDTKHYEGLFDRHRRDGRVQELKKRAIWPKTSTLIRIVTHAGAKRLRSRERLLEHLEVNVWPILELERERKILFYVHKEMKRYMGTWLLEKWLEVDASDVEEVSDETEPDRAAKEKLLATKLWDNGLAIEHWASGRGKDIYRDFNSLVCVTEYVPNVGGLTHEANTIAALAAPGNTRVAHWSAYSPRKGSAGLANSLAAASPFYQAVFHRKATDELAQAVHRPRPAMPPADGRQKRIWVLGSQIQFSDELVAATTRTAVIDNGKDEVDLGIESDTFDRGLRFSLTDTLGLISAREVAGAMAEVFAVYECWSHVFAHALFGVSSWDAIEDLVLRESGRASDRPKSDRPPGLLRSISVSEPTPASALVERIAKPPRSWALTTRRLQKTSDIYRDGLTHFLAVPDPRRSWFPNGRLRRPWMPSGSNGYEFWGNRERFEQILDNCYAPDAQPTPF